MGTSPRVTSDERPRGHACLKGRLSLALRPANCTALVRAAAGHASPTSLWFKGVYHSLDIDQARPLLLRWRPEVRRRVLQQG